MWRTYRLRCFKYKFGLLQLLRKHFINLISLAVAHDIVHVAASLPKIIVLLRQIFYRLLKNLKNT